MKKINQEDFWIIVVTLINVGVHAYVWFSNGSLTRLYAILSNTYISEIAVIILVIGVLGWLQYKYDFLINLIACWGVIVCSPLILLFALCWFFLFLLAEKNGADEHGGGFIYEGMSWSEYIKFKFTGEGRKYAQMMD